MDMASPKPLQVLPIPTLFDRAAAAFANRPALSFEGRHWTYGELDAMVDRATAGLQRLGLGPGDKLGLCLPNTPYFVVFYYAALKAGAVVVNYNPLYVIRELRHQIEDSGTTTMVVPDLAAIYDKVAAIESLRRIIVCPFADALPTVKGIAFSILKRKMLARPVYGERIIPYSKIVASRAPPDRVPINPSDVAVLQYTGGTTGRPKGAILTHANLSINAQQTTHHMPSMRPGARKDGRRVALLPCLRDDFDPERRPQRGLRVDPAPEVRDRQHDEVAGPRQADHHACGPDDLQRDRHGSGEEARRPLQPAGLRLRRCADAG